MCLSNFTSNRIICIIIHRYGFNKLKFQSSSCVISILNLFPSEESLVLLMWSQFLSLLFEILNFLNFNKQAEKHIVDFLSDIFQGGIHEWFENGSDTEQLT